MEKQKPCRIVVPEGFASLAHATAWEDGLAQAERGLNGLWLQRIVYALEEALSDPAVVRLDLFASPELPGIEVAAYMKTPDGECEVGALLVALFQGRYDAHVASKLAVSAERARRRLVDIQHWTRERPRSLFGSNLRSPEFEKSPIRLSHGMDWRDVAMALGAHEAARSMECAQLDEHVREGNESTSKRI